MMKICVLASGSKGNCTLISSGTTTILIDMGISCKILKERMEEAGFDINTVSAILVTHAHDDHYFGLNVFSKKYNLPLYATEETASIIDIKFKDYLDKYDFSFDWAFISQNNSFEIDNLSITPFSTPHDKNGSVAYIISDKTTKIAVVTDLGYIPQNLACSLDYCDALILEMNHDLKMLQESDRKEYLKIRISSKIGHLSNIQAAEFLEQANIENLKYLFPAHISHECNDKEIISFTLNTIKKETNFKVIETFQEKASEVVILE